MALVYRTENKINGKFYYGVTNGNNPSYLGSGIILKKAIKKYGRNNFIRRTVIEFDTIEEAYEFEKLIVDQDFVDRDDCYNSCIGGIGGNGGGDGAPLAAYWRNYYKNGGISPKKGKKGHPNTHRKKGWKHPRKGTTYTRNGRVIAVAIKRYGIPRRTASRWITEGIPPRKSSPRYSTYLKLMNLC